MCDVIIRDVLRTVAGHTDAAMRKLHRTIKLKRTTPLTRPGKDE
jgi:hypothetical protein